MSDHDGECTPGNTDEEEREQPSRASQWAMSLQEDWDRELEEQG